MLTFVLIRKWLLAYRRQRVHKNIPSATYRSDSDIDIQAIIRGQGKKVKWSTDFQAAYRDKSGLEQKGLRRKK